MTRAFPSSLSFPPSSRTLLPISLQAETLRYTPRPPNAFKLSHADFVRRKHVPVTITTNDVSFAEVIGSCWYTSSNLCIT
ncbi:hypothetical protein BDQ17DRAFT_686975 [Cyathus striatus]|nr:hypothetical protein BDQ17DRAFT_686975 [Cyathus striatus]